MEPNQALNQVTGFDVDFDTGEEIDTEFGTGLTSKEIAGFTQRLFQGDYDKGSQFDEEEAQAVARSKARGAFGGSGWRGRSSFGSVSTPNLDLYDQFQNEPFGSSPMGSERRLIGSTEGQMKRLYRKAERAGLNPANYTPQQLEGMGISSGGIRTQEEVRLGSEEKERDKRARLKEALRSEQEQSRR
jgi:hypothetical protein